MRYLVSWTLLPVPPDMAKIALTLLKASEAYTSGLKQKGVNVLVCGAISRPLASMVLSSGIDLIPWIAGDVEEIMKALIEGKISDPKFLMPGCCRGRRRFGNRRGPFRRGEGSGQQPR